VLRSFAAARPVASLRSAKEKGLLIEGPKPRIPGRFPAVRKAPAFK
jgi:hypothetical protein